MDLPPFEHFNQSKPETGERLYGFSPKRVIPEDFSTSRRARK